MNNINMYLIVKYYEVNKENNFHFANSTCNPCKYQKEAKVSKDSPYCVKNAVTIWQ
jgi:hypothetical protein